MGDIGGKMTEDEAFKIKNLENLLGENKEAHNQVLHKREIYPFVMHLLSEHSTENTLYPFVMRVLEENKELIARLGRCEQSYEKEKREAAEYSELYAIYASKCAELEIEIKRLKDENKETRERNEILSRKEQAEYFMRKEAEEENSKVWKENASLKRSNAYFRNKTAKRKSK